MVVHEEPGMMPRPGVDYSILSTVASSSVSDHKKIKTHPAMKELNKEKRKKHKHPKPSQGYREENGKSKTTPRAHEGGESMLEWPSSSSFSSRISTKTQVEAEVDFKEHKIYTRESRGGDGNKGGMQVELQAVNKRPSSSTDSFLRTKNLKSLKGYKEGCSINVSSIGVPLPHTCLEKKRAQEKKHWVKMRHETPEIKRPTNFDSNTEDKTFLRSVSFQSTSSRSSSSSNSDPKFEPTQMHSRGPLHSMVEHVYIDNSDEVKMAMKDTTTIQDSCLFLDSDSYDIEDPHHHKQEQLPPIPKLNTNNLKILHKKNPDFSQRENVLQENKAYTEELVDLHRRLMALREKNTLQEIVNLIEKTGLFNITKTTFDFNLFSLDVPTVRKLQSYLRAKRS
ncbi:protein ENL-like isoform X2 [Silurus meridionalis]|uniref:protein ENL-like isoform X2 n=1 Tax=Silurus meridionalis TaxID=175797 RepID=UPI001EECEE5E|nr:protein ENL-like isoform X2 [Silurus meridionalis]